MSFLAFARACLPVAASLTAAACAPVDPAADTPAPDAQTPVSTPTTTTPAPMPQTGAALGGQRWTLQDATGADGARIEALFPPGRTLALEFAQGRVSASGASNRMSGVYRIEGGQLRAGNLAATKMACAAPLMQAEHALSALLAQPLAFSVQESMPPRLQLSAPDGAVSTWAGEQTAEVRHGGEGERVFLEVAPQRVACSHPLIPEHRCLQVRDVAYDDAGIRRPPGPWRPMYEEIEGFTFREGERTVLRLKTFWRENPPADASANVYVLDMVVESERVAP